jgi:glycosyltransferase involved in cell wall biosynthesis
MPDHEFYGWDSERVTPFFRAETSSERIAVTAACMLTPRKIFVDNDGFDEKYFAVSYNDVDYCLRLHNMGYRIIYCAGAELIHHEGMSRGSGPTPMEIRAFRTKYQNFRNPFFNINFQKKGSFEVSPEPTSDFHELLNKPEKLLFYSHNFNYEGASWVIYNIACGLQRKGKYKISMISPYDGPARKMLEENGIRTQFYADRKNFPPEILYGDSSGFQFQNEKITSHLKQENPDVLFVNVLNNYHVVNIAGELNIPVVWMVHESFDTKDYRNLIPHFILKNFINAFKQAASVVFCTPFSQHLYEQFNTKNNFRVVRNALSERFRNLDITDELKEEKRKELGIQPDELMVLNVGIISEHKNQELLVNTSGLLRNEKFRFYLVGARENELYLQKITNLINAADLGKTVTLIPETHNIDKYYAAADIFVFTSKNDTYPLVILEAMAFGLPIITTPINGVNEQVRFEVNALKTAYSNPVILAEQIRKLAENKELRREMAKNSRIIFEYLDTFDEMINAHEQVIISAWQGFETNS